jgi:hypothetical protein
LEKPITSLTPFERLSLMNQLAILKKLDPEGAEDYDNQIQILHSGYSVLYGEVFQYVYEEMPLEECEYVFDVLDMHRLLRQSYDRLEDKGGITESDIRFRGFDGNNETKRYAFAQFLQKTGKWTETLVGGLNSHSMMTMHRYPKMLEKWNRITEKHKQKDGMRDWWLLTAEEIKEVIGK